MANYYNTLLECKSNKQLMQEIDPRDIIKKTNSEFITYKDGMYYFQTCNGVLHDDIVELSKTCPKEIFIAQIWNVDFYDSEVRTIRYKNGKSRITNIEPNYGYTASHIIKVMGKETFHSLMKVAMRYIRQYGVIRNTPEVEKEISKEKNDKINSNVTVHVENDKYKIDATLVGSSYIEVNGFVKRPSRPSWKLIEEQIGLNRGHDQQNEQNITETNNEDYCDLPF